MSAFDDLMAAGVAEMIAAAGGSFSFRGTTYSGLLSDLSADEKLSIGGAIPNVKQTLLFALVAFNPAIRTGESVTIGSRTMRIGLVEKDETSITLYLCSPDE